MLYLKGCATVILVRELTLCLSFRPVSGVGTTLWWCETAVHLTPRWCRVTAAGSAPAPSCLRVTCYTSGSAPTAAFPGRASRPSTASVSRSDSHGKAWKKYCHGKSWKSGKKIKSWKSKKYPKKVMEKSWNFFSAITNHTREVPMIQYL